MTLDEQFILKRLGYDIETSLRRLGIVKELVKSQREQIASDVLDAVKGKAA